MKRILKKVFKFFLKEDVMENLIKKGLVIDNTSRKTCYSVNGIDALFPWLIEIGKNVIISTDCRIYAHDASLAQLCGFSKIGCVKIKDNVYIGNNVTILPGVTIGNNVVVGAKSLVSKNLADNGVYAGCPAKYICSLDEFKKKHIDLKENSTFFENNYEYYSNCTQQERLDMKSKLENQCGYIKSKRI